MIALDINDNVLVEQRKVLEQALSTNPKTQKALQKLIQQVLKDAASRLWQPPKAHSIAIHEVPRRVSAEWCIKSYLGPT